MTSTRKVDYIFIAKAIGMLAVMWGHTRLSGWSFNWVYAWHIPLFFFLSGMVFAPARYGSFGHFLHKKWQSLLLPYLVYSFVTWLIWCAVMYFTGAQVSYLSPFIETFIARGSGGFLLHNVPLWFVTCLFVMEVVYYFLSRLRPLYRLLISILMCAASQLMICYGTCIDITLAPWSMEVACLGMPCLVLGHLLVEQWGYDKPQTAVTSHKWAAIAIFVVVTAIVVAGSQYNGRISFGHADMGRSIWLTYGLALLGIVGALIVSILLDGSQASTQAHWSLRYIKWIGRNSFRFMALHDMIKYVAMVIVSAVVHCKLDDIPYQTPASLFTYVLMLPMVSGVVWCIEKLTQKHRK